MRDASANEIMNQAQRLERQGKVAEALQYLMGVGAVDPAVQLLLRHRRYVDAARLRLQSLKVVRRDIRKLPESKKRQVFEAASYLEKGHEWSHAAELYLSLDRPDRARLVFDQAILSFADITRQHPQYHEACLKLIQLATTLDLISFELDHILSHFIERGPLKDRDLEFFYQLGKLYLQKQQYENAEQVLSQLLRHTNQYRDARDLLSRTQARQQRPSDRFQETLQRERYASYATGTQGQPLPLLDEVKDLPELPQRPNQFAPSPETPAPPSASKEDLFPALTAQIRRQTPAAGYITSTPQQLERVDVAPTPPDELWSYEPQTDVHDSFPHDYDFETQQGGLYAADPDFPPDAPAAMSESGTQTDLPAASPKVTNVTPASLESDFLYQFALGATIAERYRIIEQIGQGGMATVFCAFDDQLDEKVALKVFDPFYSNEETLQRFKREIKLNRKLSHPNVVRLYDLGSHNQYHYISMELLSGRDLESVQMDLGVFGIHEGVRLLLQVCSGLQAAHDLGVIHRDIKLSNFFLTADGTLKVMDFGIAIDTQTTRLTATGNVVGTGAYMAPERAMGEHNITPASDLYSVGVMAFEMFTGQLPFYHQQVIPLLMMHVHNAPPNPRRLNNQIPETLSNIILKLLSKKPHDRYSSSRELALALSAFQQNLR